MTTQRSEINTDRSGLVVHTGGFPSRAHLQQILRLAGAAQAPLFHWGDIDGGGLRIFRHLESALALRKLQLRPHLMDAALLQEHGVTGEKSIRLADAPAQESVIRKLWDALVETNLILEHESLPPCRPTITG